MSNKISIILLSASLVIMSGCGGRTANPVLKSQYGDSKISCEGLQQDMSFVESEIRRLLPETEKTGKNVGLGVAGAFLLVPWFFMDFSDSEMIEINALRTRLNHLGILSEEKDCGFNFKRIEEFKAEAT